MILPKFNVQDEVIFLNVFGEYAGGKILAYDIKHNSSEWRYYLEGIHSSFSENDAIYYWGEYKYGEDTITDWIKIKHENN